MRSSVKQSDQLLYLGLSVCRQLFLCLVWSNSCWEHRHWYECNIESRVRCHSYQHIDIDSLSRANHWNSVLNRLIFRNWNLVEFECWTFIFSSAVRDSSYKTFVTSLLSSQYFNSKSSHIDFLFHTGFNFIISVVYFPSIPRFVSSRSFRISHQ